MTEVPVTDWANYEGDLPEQYPHRQPRPGSRLGRTSPITGPDFGAYRKEKRRRLKARSPTLTVAKVEPDDRIPTFNKITFENGIVTGYPKSKNAKVGDKFVVSSQNGRFAHIMDAEEGSAPIQDPMEFGEMANWTPLDGSEGLKRKRAEDDDYEYSCDICDKPAKYNFQDSTLRWEIIDDDFADKPMWSEDSGQGFNDFYCGDCAKKQETSRFYNAETFEADFDYYYTVYDKARGMEILDRLRTMNPETKSKALDWLIDNGFLHSEEVFNSAYINAMGDALYITSEEDDYDAEVMNYSDYVWVLKETNRHGTEATLHRTKQDLSQFLEEYAGNVEELEEGEWGWSGYFGNDSFHISCTRQIVKDAESFSAESPSATIPVNYPKHLQPDWQKTPASSKKMAKEMRQALETEDPAARHAALFAMQDKYGDYWNQQSFNDAFKKEMEGSEPTWVKPVATALGFALGFFGIHEIKKVL